MTEKERGTVMYACAQACECGWQYLNGDLIYVKALFCCSEDNCNQANEFPATFACNSAEHVYSNSLKLVWFSVYFVIIFPKLLFFDYNYM